MKPSINVYNTWREKERMIEGGRSRDRGDIRLRVGLLRSFVFFLVHYHREEQLSSSL